MDNEFKREVSIPVGKVILKGELFLPDKPKAIIIFSHGSSRFSSCDQTVAKYLYAKKFGTLLFDLLTEQEDRNYYNRFDINLLTKRLAGVTGWFERHHYPAEYCPLGYFSASTGAASALRAAALLPQIKAVVSRGGRPDLAIEDLYKVESPTLFIVGAVDYEVMQLNKLACEQLECKKKLAVIEGASHLFKEEGTMDRVCELSVAWFTKYLHATKKGKTMNPIIL
jgi:dienelactone hydrolase